ncbi:MAG: hypothetical protein QXM55_05595, partial [Ignisphaera sp.]
MYLVKEGILVAIEGIDGSGKTTVAIKLVKKLKELGYKVEYTYEPFSSPFSEALKKYKAVMGGEENGKVVLPEHLNSGDGGLALALVLDLLSDTEQKLSDLIGQLPD